MKLLSSETRLAQESFRGVPLYMMAHALTDMNVCYITVKGLRLLLAMLFRLTTDIFNMDVSVYPIRVCLTLFQQFCLYVTFSVKNSVNLNWCYIFYPILLS